MDLNERAKNNLFEFDIDSSLSINFLISLNKSSEILLVLSQLFNNDDALQQTELHIIIIAILFKNFIFFPSKIIKIISNMLIYTHFCICFLYGT